MTIIYAARPSDSKHAKDGHIHTIYDTESDAPYHVDNGKGKINKAREVVDLDEYELTDREAWMRFDYESIEEGETERIFIHEVDQE